MLDDYIFGQDIENRHAKINVDEKKRLRIHESLQSNIDSQSYRVHLIIDDSENIKQ